MDDFEKELKQVFLEEAGQLLSDTEQCFLALESNPKDSAILDNIFRLAHNLKGSSKAVGFDEMGAFTHELESLLLNLKNGDIPVQTATVSLLLRCNDQIRVMINALKGDFSAKIDCSQLIAEIQDHREGKITDEGVPDSSDLAQASVAAGTNESVQSVQEQTQEAEKGPEESDSLERQEQSEVQADQVPSMPLQTSQSEANVSPNQNAGPAKASGSDESIRVSLERLEKLINFVGELVILQTVLREISLGSNPQLLRKTIHQMGKVTKEVQDISMSLRMVSVKQTFQKMQRIVRDTSSILNKKVHLTFQGEETELDKTVLESLSDPLVHLIRNAVDHGIELPEERLKKGKPEMGQLLLQAFRQSDKLVIEVTEDGAGIDGAKLQAKAIEKGILRAGTTLSPNDAVQLIFHPGFSTKEKVTEVSGRGVGMDVVKTNIEKLQGEVQVKTEVNKGTTFRIILPLTLAIIDGMVITSDEDRFVVPLSHVHESLRPMESDVHHVTGVGNLLALRGETLPLYSLCKLLGRPESKKKPWDCIALIVRIQKNPFAVLVDDIIGQYQVVIKKLGSEVKNVKGFSGSAILGDGRPSLILELVDIVADSKSKGNQNLNQESKWRATA